MLAPGKTNVLRVSDVPLTLAGYVEWPTLNACTREKLNALICRALRRKHDPRERLIASPFAIRCLIVRVVLGAVPGAEFE
jgi:hypothetical protein